MTFDINQFLNSRDEWHYWWVGFAAGWTAGTAAGLFLLGWYIC